MKKYIGFVLGLMMVFGLATAQITTQTVPTGDYSYGAKSVSVTEKIVITIPNRVALHITDTGFSLNLDNLGAFIGTGYNGLRNCFLVPKSLQGGILTFADLEAAIALGIKVSSYPAVVLDANGNIVLDTNLGYLKGGLVCVNFKVVQKFSNATRGWQLDATVDLNGNVGQFGILDSADEALVAVGGGYTSGSLYASTSLVSKLVSADTSFNLATNTDYNVGYTTGGFLDDYIAEFFYFDGSETAGTGGVDVMFTLTGNF